MKDRRLLWVFLLAISIFVTGCFKKSSEQTNIAGTGFDSATATPATTSEELSQLPQASATNQQNSVEALPIEATPVTQAASTVAGTSATEMASTTKSLAHEQQIQTALKNLGLYNGKIDGKLGPGSKKAISEFQKQNGLKVDGKVGPKTWTALSTHLNGPEVSPATTSAASSTDAPAGNQ